MKIVFAVPPIESKKGYPTATQSRQFQYLKDPTFIYPIVPALAMTMLIEADQEVLWIDCVADNLTDVEFGRVIIQMKPDYIVFESPTPIIKRYWEIIDGIKHNLPEIKSVLCGAHVTALPAESIEKSKVDIVLNGGKWPFDLFKLITGKDWEKGKLLPHINRDVTRWWLYAYKNGNFQYIPATYIMSSVDCWHRPGCTFCSWGDYFKEYSLRPVEDVLDEIEELINKGFKEIFDDSGTFPTGAWLKTFCREMKERGYSDHISLGCNMRFGALKDQDYLLMHDAGFRMILWGLESVHQKTLDILNKGYNIKSVSHDLILSKAAGIKNHITVMFGYPWESLDKAKQTFNTVKWMLLNGWAWSAQATICVPYPGTILYEYCKEQNLLITEDWSEYDMSRAIMKIPYEEKELFKLQKGIYDIAYHPKFIWNKLKDIKSIDDLKYYFRLGRKIYDRFGQFRTIGKISQD